MKLAYFRARFKGGGAWCQASHMGQGGQCPPPPTQILGLHWARLSGKEGGLGLLNWALSTRGGHGTRAIMVFWAVVANFYLHGAGAGTIWHPLWWWWWCLGFPTLFY